MNPLYRPRILPALFPQLMWRVPDAPEQTCYLSFDDGPHPEITPRILDWLDQFGFKATFFCIGENVLRYPKTFELLQSSGMCIGNHTMSHANGWRNSIPAYLNDIAKADACMQTPLLFRPPYGRMTLPQMRAIQKYKTIVMWSMVSGDWQKGLNCSETLRQLRKHTKAGFIPVFHDSAKAWPQLKQFLPDYLDFLSANQWQSIGINNSKSYL